MPPFEIAQHFVSKVQAAESEAELFALLRDVSTEIGFHFFALVHHVDLRRPLPRAIRLENYPVSWAALFVENGFYAYDPIHCASLTSNIGFTWADVPRKIAITSRQRAILETAAKHGLGEGYTVPANIPGECSGSCSFAMRLGQSLREENLLLAQLIGGFAFEAARRLAREGSSAPPSPPRLTPRQHECLLLAMQGKSDWDIGQILGLSPETVNQHFDTARTRFGVAKRVQLAIRAIYDGQISFIEALSWQHPWLGE
jgi:LuxR family quorum-sensing system transcriptional regulator CciR